MDKHGSATLIKLKIALPVMAACLVCLIIAATAIGSVGVPLGMTGKIILKNLLKLDIQVPENLEHIIYYVRFPRVLLAVIVGSALAVSGGVMQGMFRNPMADPGIIGISSGASLGAVIAIGLGLVSGSMFFLPLFASIGSLSAAFIIYMLSMRKGKIPLMNLILTGIAVSMLLNAVITLVLSLVSGDRVKQFFFWTLGSLSTARWEDIQIVFVPASAGVIILNLFARDLNIMMLGEEEAHSLGLNPSSYRKLLLLFSSLTTAAAVCVSGTISFVGLIVPHIVRLATGPDHRILLPVSAFGGAIFLVVCDLIGRVAPIPGGIGAGIITSLLGAPYFLFLLNRRRKTGGVL